MTHKDYVKLADAIAVARDRDWPTVKAALDDVENNIAYALAHDNPRFDRERFHAAAIGQPLTGRDQL